MKGGFNKIRGGGGEIFEFDHDEKAKGEENVIELHL